MSNRTILVLLSFIICLTGNAQSKLSDFSKKNYDLGIASYGKKEYSEAISYFSKVTKSYPKHSYSYYYRGLSYIKSNKEQLALVDFKYLINSNQLADKAHLEIGKIYMNQLNYTKALESFSSAKLVNPKNAAIYYQEGILYYKRKKHQKAIG